MNCEPIVTVNDLAQELEHRGIIPTRQRLLIAQLLFNRDTHFTANELYLQVNKGHRRVCRATVYNVLNVFVQAGIVRAINVDAGRTFYDVNTQPHHHFYNVDTGVLSDVPTNSLPTQIDSIQLPSGTRLTGEPIQLVIKVRNHSLDAAHSIASHTASSVQATDFSTSL